MGTFRFEYEYDFSNPVRVSYSNLKVPNVSTAATIPSPLSDHNVTIILVRKINGLRQKPRLINCRNYENHDPTLFHDDLEAAPWDEVLALQDVTVEPGQAYPFRLY